MPHRPNSGVTSSSNSTGYTRINGLSEEAAAEIIRYPQQQTGVVTPLIGAKPWISGQHPGLRGTLPSLENHKSSDSIDRSVTTKHDDSTVATLATELSADEMEKRENIANALLLVSTAAIRHIASNQRTEDSSSPLTGPLKKRPKHGDFMRRHSEEEQQQEACHVSPVSHDSSLEGRTVSREESTTQRPGRLGPQTARSHSYDSKDSPPYQKESAQELPDSAKIHNAQEIVVPSQVVVVPHFPTVLHRVLSDEQLAGSVVTWLPDGESWKVLRWDALRREVLPRYFATLRDENGSGCGTIDAFLYHLTAWGFDEVKDGSAVGAYRHELFIRGAQKLSNKMSFTGAPRDNEGAASSQTYEVEDRSMLQVPTLAKETVRVQHDEPQSHPGVIRRPSPGPITWYMGGYQQRNEEQYVETQTWGHGYPDHANPKYPGSSMFNDPRYAMSRQRPVDTGYNPPQVRSGRGAIRVVTGAPPRPAPSTGLPPSHSGRSSFPVSNRGKGRVVGALPASNYDGGRSTSRSSSPSYSSVSIEEAQRVGNSVKAVGTSRKTKRKLPLARKPDQASTEALQA